MIHHMASIEKQVR